MHSGARTTGVALALAVATAHLAGSPGAAPVRVARAPAASAFALTVDSIMRGPKLVGYPPGGLRWSGDSSRLYFEWRRPQDDEAATWVIARSGPDSAAPRRLTDEERRSAPPAEGVWDAAHRRVLFVDAGDIVLVDTAGGVRKPITRTTAVEANPRWAKHESAVTFTRGNNLFLVPLDSGAIVQLTDVAPKKHEEKETDSQEFVKSEEAQLIDHTRVQEEKKKKAEDKEKARALPKLELADRQTATDLQLSPDGSHVFVLLVQRAEGAKRPMVASYVTASSYSEETRARGYVGDTQDARTLAVMNLATGKTVMADAAFAGAARSVRWSMPELADDGALAVADVRAKDNKDRWLVAVDPGTGGTRIVDALHDDAWVREVGDFGPGHASFGWLGDNRHLWFLSERDGWMHLYTVDAAADRPSARQLTEGRWEIDSVALSQDRQTFYLTSTEADPGERQLYSLPVDGGVRTRLTSMTGENLGEVSPDGSTIGLVYSYSTKPPELYLMPNRPGAAATRVTTSPTAEWRSFPWADPQVITYKTRDGADVHARLYTPEMLGARRDPSAPAVIFIHGAGYLQNAHKYWSSYFREYMFNNLLASRGYVVLDPDYRASAGYGRDWRTAIYRHMGGKDLDDVVDGAKYLVDHQKVNPKRIGVYGGSYGGFLTLMAMFTSPDTFAAGAALRPVSDWSHYNNGYTSDILNLPQSDPEAYRRSSPIYFADGLRGWLLICHGMVDTNVLFQDTARLVQRLIELRKERWSVAMYPVENHGFEEETSWADEYKRVLALFEAHLTSHDARRAS